MPLPSLKFYTKISMFNMNTEKQIFRAETSSEERNPDQEKNQD